MAKKMENKVKLRKEWGENTKGKGFPGAGAVKTGK